MSTMSIKELSDALYKQVVQELKQSNPYTTKESVSRRVLQQCAEILNIDLNCYSDKNKMYIHLDNMAKIDSKWQTLMDEGTKISHDEHNTYKLLKSTDLVNILDVQKFINIISNKEDDYFLAELLAMDGFQGLTDYKNYIENLKNGDKGSDHIQIVREIYKKFNVPVKIVYYALLKIYEKYVNDDEESITEIIEELSPEIDDSDISTIMEFYENAIGDLKSVALIKLAQLKNHKKKSKTLKRKFKVLKDRKNSKSTQTEDKITKKQKKKIKSSEVKDETDTKEKKKLKLSDDDSEMDISENKKLPISDDEDDFNINESETIKTFVVEDDED